jgi:hypothetical protein
MNYRIVIPAACLLMVAGCGGSSGGSGSAAAPAAPPPGAEATGVVKTTAAVREGSGNAAIRVRFLLESAPVVGQEVPVQLDFSSYISEPVTLDVTFAGEQIDLKPDAAAASISLPRSGEDVRHTLIVTPRVAGLSELRVHAKIAGEEGGAEATYVIPILSDKTGPAGKANNASP